MADFRNRIKEAIKRFREAFYGEEVREAYADIAEIVCIDSMEQIDREIEKAEQKIEESKEQTKLCNTQTKDCKDATAAALRAAEIAAKELIIFDPIDGKKATVQEVSNHLYQYILKINAKPITAKEFDDLKITANAFNTKKISARDFNQNGKNILKSS